MRRSDASRARSVITCVPSAEGFAKLTPAAIDLTALHFAAGSQVDGTMIINSTLITKDNAHEFDYANTPF